MATEYVIETFLNAQGKRMHVGDKAPEEARTNLEKYRGLGLIGTEAEFEARHPGSDVGRKGKAATRKSKAKPAAD